MNSGFGQITIPLKQMLRTVVSVWLLIVSMSVMAAGYEGFGITAGGVAIVVRWFRSLRLRIAARAHCEKQLRRAIDASFLCGPARFA